nr:putative histidinol-phosphatase [Quercus suber]
MPWSHHSHSGQFCGHAANTLEEIVQKAIDKNMTTLCLTEHIHRERQDFYPEEENSHTEASLEQLYDTFYQEARRLKQVYAPRIEIFVGFEGEWIRPQSLTIMQHLLDKYPVDLFLGSVHHVHTIPIDYDTAQYHDARKVAGGTDEQIFADYFDSQYELLSVMKPPVVGHFDLIRLKADNPDCSFRTWSVVWNKIVRNLTSIAEYGGILELNSSSIRKGMIEAYPQVEICKVRSIPVQSTSTLLISTSVGIKQLYHLSAIDPLDVAPDPRFPNVCWKAVDVTELKEHAFWTISLWWYPTPALPALLESTHVELSHGSGSLICNYIDLQLRPIEDRHRLAVEDKF